ncbi:MAG: NAD(P)-binding domain-containing protein [Gemmatimonadota bacterium]|nr:NAD(P)-binding domain-containing protein [Gemmatimonadota bacterium]MDH5759460.1 NAD(P)-binding domain-containing protein [Gemmatimonadota bacterium]
MSTDQLIIWGTGLLLTLVVVLPVFLRQRKVERETDEAEIEALRYGLHEPVSLHPVVDPDRCIGIGNCVEMCPEGVLGIRHGQGIAVRPARCIGHGLCERVCPMEAIKLVFGTESRGVDLPRVKEDFETNVPGLYIVGELGGMGLVANAFEQGRQCVEGIVKAKNRGIGADGPSGLLDVIVVGCGPAGLSASLAARHAGLTCLTLEREDVGGTVRHYPRKKLVMTRPVTVPGYGRLPVRDILKEDLIDLWEEVTRSTGLEVRTGSTVSGIRRLGPHHFQVTSTGGTFEARRVILAIGRRGVPRKLGVPGEHAPHVAYSLREPEAYSGDRILVVGGGDSAVEAALALADDSTNEVRISYRKSTFGRIKPKNHERIGDAIASGRVEPLWETTPAEIHPEYVSLTGTTRGDLVTVPSSQVFVFIGGELPTPFLRSCGIEIETKFGTP